MSEFYVNLIALAVRRQICAWVALALAPRIDGSRVYLGLRYPLDVAAGAADGTASAWMRWQLPRWRALARVDGLPIDPVAAPAPTDQPDGTPPRPDYRSASANP